jgi:hypothetical protein
VARLVIKAMPAEMTKDHSVVWRTVEDVAAELGRLADARQPEAGQSDGEDK